jgi:hypothetical protein
MLDWFRIINAVRHSANRMTEAGEEPTKLAALRLPVRGRSLEPRSPASRLVPRER